MSVIITQQLFCQNFDVPRRGAVPSKNTIKRWVVNFRNKASALKLKPAKSPRSVRSQEQIEDVTCASALQSPNSLVMLLKVADSLGTVVITLVF